MPPRRTPRSIPLPPADGTFVAIDFETADYGPDSACAVGLVRVEALTVVRREALLIQPPRRRVLFTHVHGITWMMVKDAPGFADAWLHLCPLLDGASALVAHYAPFDRGSWPHAARLAVARPGPAVPLHSPARRRHWGLKPNDLPSVCRRLGIGLVHHDPGSDAEACARIVIRGGQWSQRGDEFVALASVRRTGERYPPRFGSTSGVTGSCTGPISALLACAHFLVQG